MHLVNRTCTAVSENGLDELIRVSSQPVSSYEDLPAYVLLGDPGEGKTTVFEQEAERQGACFVTARDLITFDIDNHPEWHGNTLFIDGLDEIRAGSLDARTPFDGIRAKLDKLGHPRFRLSCREADWFGASDQDRLKTVSPDGRVTLLHLDPLTEDDVLEILGHEHGESYASSFVKQAKERSLEELLTNPQVLDMLMRAVTNENWPDTRKQTFELACRTMVREHNEEHISAASTQSVDENLLLDAAGFLCAVQLIAGNAGYALTRAAVASEFPYINEPAYDDKSLLKKVTRTKLFKAPDQGRVIPVHRYVAEYLAAGALSRRVDQSGLPIGRVLALITGEDGIVVSELRGLSAWLAALCVRQRNTIIDRDPLGVVLYGDVQDFSRHDKRQILDGLQKEAARYPWFRSSNWTSSPFGALATPDMEVEFRKILTAPGRGETDQSLADCVLDAMIHGVRFSSMGVILMDVIRDTRWWPRVRRAALEVINRGLEEEPDAASRMKSILNEINSGSIADSDDDLTGYLLTELYPEQVSSKEVLNYLHAPTRRNYIGNYVHFWRHRILEQSSDEDVGVLLDQLVSRLDSIHTLLDDHHLYGMTTGLLAKGLELHGDSVSKQRLYKWLGTGLDRHEFHPHGEENQISRIQNWLAARPEIQKAILSIGEQYCQGSENFGYCMYKVQSRLYRAEPPSDYGIWCLQHLPLQSNDEIAKYMLAEAIGAITYKRGDAGLSLELIEETAEQDNNHKTWLEDMLFCPVDEEQRKFQKNHQLRKSKEKKKRQEWIDYVRSQEAALREGTALPHLLHDLATAYFGHFVDSEGETPAERLNNFLDHDDDLVESILVGLRHSLERDDVPAVSEIIQLYTQDRTYHLSRPVLAGLDENTNYSPDYVLHLDDDHIRKALAFYLTEATGDDVEWYKLLLESRPDLIAEVMTAYVTAALRSKKQHISGLYALAYTDKYSSVARLATLAMLKVFPARCTNQQLIPLDELLKAALRYADRQALLALIEEKLNLSSMNVAQRAHWLAAGLIADPDNYQKNLKEFTQGNEKRTQHLAAFLADRHDQWSPLGDLPVSTVGLLVRLIGRYFAPYSLEGSSWVSPAMSAADFVNRLINHLGANPGKETTDIIDLLLEDSDLLKWHNALQRAQFEQRAARREAGFRHPGIVQVSSTLNNGVPANAGDLAALVLDLLQDMADRIRNGSTDDYRQFWNEGPHRQLESPKHEDACRDALLSDLQQQLAPHGVDAQPEGHYADDKHADIRVARGGMDGFAVPIEIKKNSHTNLWHAIHDQLIAQYTRDPPADGFGIYLVFWFGADKTKPPPSGRRPATAEEMVDRICATLSVEERRKISICGIDVTKP
jgi:hypothetical protein